MFDEKRSELKDPKEKYCIEDLEWMNLATEGHTRFLSWKVDAEGHANRSERNDEEWKRWQKKTQ